jgi:hypothetical protein
MAHSISGGIMSTPLIILAAILAILAFILIPLMMYKGDKQNQDQHAHGNQGKKQHKKKKKR